MDQLLCVSPLLEFQDNRLPVHESFVTRIYQRTAELATWIHQLCKISNFVKLGKSICSEGNRSDGSKEDEE